MFVLKKVKGGSMVEVIVAAVIVLLVFGIASATLNNIYYSSFKLNKSQLNYQLEKHFYLMKNNAVKIPSIQVFDSFELQLSQENEQYRIEVVSLDSRKTVKTMKKYAN